MYDCSTVGSSSCRSAACVLELRVRHVCLLESQCGGAHVLDSQSPLSTSLGVIRDWSKVNDWSPWQSSHPDGCDVTLLEQGQRLEPLIGGRSWRWGRSAACVSTVPARGCVARPFTVHSTRSARAIWSAAWAAASAFCSAVLRSDKKKRPDFRSYTLRPCGRLRISSAITFAGAAYSDRPNEA